MIMSRSCEECGTEEITAYALGPMIKVLGDNGIVLDPFLAYHIAKFLGDRDERRDVCVYCENDHDEE